LNSQLSLSLVNEPSQADPSIHPLKRTRSGQTQQPLALQVLNAMSFRYNIRYKQHFIETSEKLVVYHSGEANLVFLLFDEIASAKNASQ
jgi:hypothetical protein